MPGVAVFVHGNSGILALMVPLLCNVFGVYVRAF
jgi:hypothetical protein